MGWEQSSALRVAPMVQSQEDIEGSSFKKAPDDPKTPPNDKLTADPASSNNLPAASGRRAYTAPERETAIYFAQIAQQAKVTVKQLGSQPPVGAERLASSSKPVEKNLRFAEEETDALPLHASVFRPFDPKDHPSRVNDFSTLGKRLLRLGLTCTYPPQSFNRPLGNPEWSLKSILQSRYRADTDPRVVEYEAQFVWANGREAPRQWLTFEELNWPWGIRVMRCFHQRNMFRPMDVRMQDQSVLATEARVERSEWFNGKDIYKEEYLSKMIYLQTKYEQVELYKNSTAVNESMNRGRNTMRSPPLYLSPSPHGKGKGASEKPRGRTLTRSPPRGDPSDTEMTDVTSVSDHSYYSEGKDPEMLAIYEKAQQDFRAGGGPGLRRHLSVGPAERSTTTFHADQKTEEQEALEKAVWREKMRLTAERIKNARLLSGPSNMKKKNDDTDKNQVEWKPPTTLHNLRPPHNKPSEKWQSPDFYHRYGDWLPPVVLPSYDNLKTIPSVSSPPPKLATLNQLLTDIKVTPPIRYERPLAKKKGSKSSRNVGGKERHLGISVEGTEEEMGDSVMAGLDEEFDADTEDAGDALDPLASKRSRESAGSHRGDLKRTRFFDQGGKMEGVEEGEKYGHGEGEQDDGPEETKVSEGDGAGDDEESVGKDNMDGSEGKGSAGSTNP
ncbi:hypothetical protein TWF102_009420 [Orbilia oligospora]|uniref:Uncharacterized protein n=2 Tax=Orbilia oligospora TaxID=2813651 RepID=A0A7C8NLM9_ORBOL|nr:hypothetical protein TWF706_010526 [Orbilia oligospora]KAF3090206.1 hypothetical protein TWF102_009420 [Orbilia oligospora]KAF3141807.1 hypothetical protein TWF594_005865 [Orbilia oligospora]